MDRNEHDEPTSVGATIGAAVGVLLAVLVGALIVFLVFGAGVFDDGGATPALDDGTGTEAGAGSARPLAPPPIALDAPPPAARSSARVRRGRTPGPRRRAGAHLIAGDTP